MTARSRILQTTPSPTTKPPPPVQTLDPDFAVILAALLCALICILGLLAVVRCAWIRRFSSTFSSSATTTVPAPNKGLKKKVLKALPSMTYRDDSEQATKLTECAICLAEFESGEEIRVLPNCGHGFHIGCIDTWLTSHSSCPSCRQVLVAPRCKNCGVGSGGIQPEPRENHVNSFLP